MTLPLREVDAHTRAPLGADELSLSAIADWGPAEEWSDWFAAAAIGGEHETRSVADASQRRSGQVRGRVRSRESLR